MGFVLDGLDTETYDRNYSDRELLARIVSYFRPHGRSMFVVALMIALNAVAGAGGPILISNAVDMVREAERPSTQLLMLASAGVLLLGLSAWLTNFIRQYLSVQVIGDVVLKIRDDVFAATINHDLSFYDEHASGRIVSRVTSDTQDFSQVANLTVNLIGRILLVVGLFIWLLRINVPLTLLLLGMTPFAAAIALSFRRVARQVTQNARRVTAKVNAQIQESISGITVAKSFRQEGSTYAQFDETNRQSYAVGLRRGLTLNTIFPIMNLTAGFGIALQLYLGGLATQDGLVTPGNWLLFMQSIGFFWWPLMDIASFWSQFQDGLSAAERVFALIDAEPKVVQLAAEPVETLSGEITFRELSFAYNEDEVVLPDFSLTVAPKETLALVGHTGAGKSSVARLISRFYEFQDGELLVDGRDIRRLDLSQYRQQVGVVPQDPFLFSGTVMENIRYGRPEATDEEVCAAAEAISDGEWLSSLADGLATDAGERGANLSMGQRQLVALARVLLKDPAIFVLDEATASVDPFTEAQIQEGLETIMADRTAIVIAHRLSTVKGADRILVIREGRITEEGNHRGLMAAGGHYAELYDTYFRHQSADYQVDLLPEDLAPEEAVTAD